MSVEMLTRRRGRRLLLAFASTISCVIPAASAEAQTLYVARNAVGINQIAQFHIEADGTLTALDPANANAGARPSDLATSPDGKSLYAVSSSGGDVYQYDVSASGALAAKDPFAVAAGSGTHGAIAVRPDGVGVYATAAGDAPFPNRVSQYSADALGRLTPKGTPIATDANGDTDLIATSKRVFVSSRLGNVIRQFGYDANDELAAGPTVSLSCASGLAATPNEASVYATAAGCASSIAQYDVSPTTGLLTAKAPATAPLPDGSGESMAASPSSLYVSNQSGFDQLNIDPTTGALTAGSSPVVSSTFNGVAVSPDGSSVYAVNTNASTILQFTVGAGGALTPKVPASVSVPGGPSRIAVSAIGDGTSPPPDPPPVVPPTPAPPDPTPPSDPPADVRAYLTFEGNTITVFEIDKNGKTKIRGTCDLPSSVEGDQISCLGATAFYLSKIKNVPGGILLPSGFPPLPRAATKQPKPIAKATFSIPNGETKTIKLKLSKAGKKALAKKGKLKVYQYTAVRSGPDTIATGQDKVTLKLKRK